MPILQVDLLSLDELPWPWVGASFADKKFCNILLSDVHDLPASLAIGTYARFPLAR